MNYQDQSHMETTNDFVSDRSEAIAMLDGRFWQVTLTAAKPRHKTKVIRTLHKVAHHTLGFSNLADARRQVETAPSVIYVSIFKVQAEAIQTKLSEAGGICCVDRAADGVNDQGTMCFGWDLHCLSIAGADRSALVKILAKYSLLGADDAPGLLAKLPGVFAFDATIHRASRLKEDVAATGAVVVLTPETRLVRPKEYWVLF